MNSASSLSSDDFSDNPALEIFAVLQDAFRLARRALVDVHTQMLVDDPVTAHGEEAAPRAYAFAILFQMQALEDTIRSYTMSVECLRHLQGEEESEDLPF